MRKISVLLIIAILVSMLITGCNKTTAPVPSPAPEVSESAGAPESESETNETPAVDAPEAETLPAITAEPPANEPESAGEGASSPSKAPVEEEIPADDGLCGYPLAQPVTTAFEMYMQHYLENGSIIEIPQILDDSPTAESINRELREIGEEYYKQYSHYNGTRRCEVIAYPCETEDYLCIVLVERELPDDDSYGDVESWVYEKKTQSQLMIDVAFDPETIKAALQPGMEFREIEDIEYRHVDNGHGEYYITVEYEIDGEEFEDLFIMRDGQLRQHTEGPIIPSYAVAVFAEPLWAQWEENHNYMYDTTVPDEKIAEVGDRIVTLAIREQNILLDETEVEARFVCTGDCLGYKNCLIYQVYTENNVFTNFGNYFYVIDEDAYYGPVTNREDTKRIE